MSAPYPPPAAAPSNDRTTLWGVLGLVIGLICCPVIGVIFGALSIRDAKKFGKSTVLGWVAIILSVLSLVGNSIFWATRNN